MTHKHSAQILSALNKLEKEPFVVLELEPMTYKQINSLRKKAQRHAKLFRKLDISTSTKLSDKMTILFLSVK